MVTITTKVTSIVPKIQINLNNLPAQYHGLYLVSNLAAAFDQQGEIRWLYSQASSGFSQKLMNGNILLNADGFNFFEATMLGQIIRNYNVPTGIHHEIKELPSGNFIVGTSSVSPATNEDVLVEVDRSSGQIVKTWDFNLLLDPSRTFLPMGSTRDWLHLNGAYFDARDNSIVISSRHQSAVVKLDYATGKVKWILGAHAYWNSNFSQNLLTPVDSKGNEIDPSQSDFWQYGQHAPLLLRNGNILLYDNGNYRGFYDGKPDVQQNGYTRAVEYKIDENEKTVELVWKFDNNKSVFTMATGFVDHQYDTDTRLIAYMWGTAGCPKIVELDNSSNIIFEAVIDAGSKYYRGFKLDVYAGLD